MEQKQQYSLFSSPPVTLYAVVGILYFVSAKLGIYLFNTFHTSPAVIWPPVGIAFAAMIFGGYRMWIPIFLAQFAVLFDPSIPGVIKALGIAIGYTLQSVLALYLLRRFTFEPIMGKLRNTLIIVMLSVIVTAIAPLISTVVQAQLNPISTDFWLMFSRAWGGSIFSALIITPFAVTWWTSGKKIETSKHEKIEIAAAFAILMANNYFLFWTHYAQYIGIAVIFFLPAVLIWFALRLEMKWLTLALVLTSAFGVAGSIISQSPSIALSAQLVSDEIYLSFVAAIFLVFVAVVEERRAAYRRLDVAYKSTTAADKAKNEFIAILAHELRNPLAPIVSTLELLKFQPLTAEALEMVNNAEEQTVMMRRLLDDLLDTARLTQRKLKLQKKNVTLKRIIDQSVASVREYVRAGNNQLQISMPTEEIVMHVDPVRLKQIVINLLNNAVKYSESGGIIRLLVERDPKNIIITVADDGVGIEPDKISKLFGAFRQVGPTSRKNSGLGIGLFLSKRLTEMHGGRIVATSPGPGKGSVFTVYLPVGMQTELSMAPSELGEIHAGEAMNILVVDDNRSAADSMQKLLNHYGHEAKTAYSGGAALSMVETYRPDVILLDIGMPDMDGYTVARKIRDTGLKTSIVAVSGYGQDNDRLQSKLAGFDQHLVKPVSIQDILGVLSSHHQMGPFAV